jgi:F0F1-type ATP synthase membrane subunit c/vacuolar-type H+-ATPase subunit K
MRRLLAALLVVIAICIAAPVTAFVDRNGITSAAEFRDYVPASYLKSAGITDSMTVAAALDAYSRTRSASPTYRVRVYLPLSNPAQVRSSPAGDRNVCIAGGRGN